MARSVAALSLIAGLFAVGFAQKSGAAPGGYRSERSVTVLVRAAPPLSQPPLGQVLDTLSPVSPDSEPALDENLLYAVLSDGHVVRRNILARRTTWQGKGATSFGNVIVATDRVYALGPNRTLFALTEKSGALLWRSRVSDSGNLQLSMIRGMLFVRGENVTRLNPRTGKVLWQAQTGRVNQIVAPSSVFVSTAQGEPIQESVAVIDAASGNLLASDDPGKPAGIARILGTRGGAVLVQASANVATIDEDSYALARIHRLDSATGRIRQDWAYRPDLARYGPDTGITDAIVDDGEVAFQTGDSIYRYELDAGPLAQQPLRIQDSGRLAAFRRSRLYTQAGDGIYEIRLDGNRAIRRRVMAYEYDPSLNEPALVQTNDAIAVSDGSTIQVLDLTTDKSRRYSAHCDALLRILRSGDFVAMQCENSAPAQAGIIYAGRLNGS